MKPNTYTKLMDTILSAAEVCRCAECGKLAYKADAQRCAMCDRMFCRECAHLDDEDLCYNCYAEEPEYEGDDPRFMEAL